MVIVDTSVWINFFNGVDSVQKELLKFLLANKVRIFITDIILTEILQGIREKNQFEKVKNTLLNLDILHATPIKSYIDAAELYRTGRERGYTIRKTTDCIIAAIAIENELPVLHQDRDFDIISKFTKLSIFTQ